MSMQALYLKYRPQTFEEVVDQEPITRTLRNALRQERVRHAYLFAGPRGTGKTTTARLLAKAVNCLAPSGQRPCNTCPICVAINEGRLLDLIEIDAASNRGIDEIRDIREKVGFRPNEGRYKVYVLDEAHMLTEPAFNALLKTLEEPPPHVIFALVTTDPHKIPATIASRCQRFDFRRISLQAIVDRLAYIAGQEDIVVEPAALELIAYQGTGALRDAISLLDQLTSYGEEITLDQVQMVLGTIAGETAGTLVRCLVDADVGGGLDQINRAVADGADPRQLGREVVEYLRGLLLLKQGAGTRLLNATAEQAVEMETLAERLSTEQLLQAIRLFNEAVTAVKGGLQMIPQLPLELALVESIMHPGAPAVVESSADEPAESQKAEIWTPPVSQTHNSSGTESRRVAEAAPDSRIETETQTESPAAAKTAPAAGPETSPPIELEAESTATEPRAQTQPESASGPENKATNSAPAPQDFGLKKVVDAWDQLLGAVRQRNPTTQAVLNTGCEPVEVNGNQIVVTFPHPFLREKLRDPQRLMEIQEAMGQVLQTRCRVKFVLASDYAPGHHAPIPTAPAMVEEPTSGVEKEPPAEGAPLAEGDLDQIKDWAEKHGGQTRVINEP